MQQRQIQKAIQSQYGVSKKTSNQVISALAEIEKHRQGTKVGLPGRPEPQQQGQPPSIETIVGGLYGGSGGILGLILTIIKRLFGLGGSAQSQGSQNQDVMNILNQLMGGASNPNQAPDLASILMGLLGGSTIGSGNQAAGIEDLVTSLLGGQMSGRTSKKSK